MEGVFPSVGGNEQIFCYRGDSPSRGNLETWRQKKKKKAKMKSIGKLIRKNPRIKGIY